MKKINEVTVTTHKLSVKHNRLFRKTIQRIKKIKTEAAMQKFEASVLAMKPGQEQRIIILSLTSVRIIKAKLGMPAAENDYLAQSAAMWSAQDSNALSYFTPAFDGMKEWSGANADMVTALKALKDGTKGGAGLKTKALARLKAVLLLALAYINKLCGAQQSLAESIIGAALMQVIKNGARVVSDITAKAGKDTASMEVSCPAAKIDGKRVAASYEKGYSKDGGTTWTDLVSLPNCKTIAYGLALNIPYIFRSRYTSTKGGTSKWVISKPVTLM